jgi:hypothetical protein
MWVCYLLRSTKLCVLRKLFFKIKRTYFSCKSLTCCLSKAHQVSPFFADFIQCDFRLQLNWLLGLTHAAYWSVPVFQHTLQFKSAGWILQLHKLRSQAQKSVLHIILHRYRVIKKSLCTWRTIPTQLMIWRWPSRNTFGTWTVLYRTRSSRTQFGVSINVWRLAGDTLNITCNFLYCNHRVHRNFLIILYFNLQENFSHLHEQRPISTDLPWIKVHNK